MRLSIGVPDGGVIGMPLSSVVTGRTLLLPVRVPPQQRGEPAATSPVIGRALARGSGTRGMTISRITEAEDRSDPPPANRLSGSSPQPRLVSI